jgi:hypothetical protein
VINGPSGLALPAAPLPASQEHAESALARSARVISRRRAGTTCLPAAAVRFDHLARNHLAHDQVAHDHFAHNPFVLSQQFVLSQFSQLSHSEGPARTRPV